MHVEDGKTLLLEAIRDLAKVDLSRAPHFFFSQCLRSELQERKLDAWVTPALAGITLEIGSFGLDYREHEEWLREFAAALADVIQNIVSTFLQFGDTVVEARLQELKITMQ